MDTGEIVWRVFGPLWATGVTLIMAFPVTVPAAIASVRALRPSSAHQRRRGMIWPLIPIVLIWAWSAAVRSDHAGPSAAVRTAGVLVLLAAHLLLLAAAWRQTRWDKSSLALLLPELWLALVASFIGLWWVQGWASL